MDTQANTGNSHKPLLPETAPFTPTQTSHVSKDGEDFPPTQLGVYHLLGKFGHGGMGRVYKAWHSRLKRQVALKFPSLDCILDSAALARFHREIELIGKLDHPNIVRATDAGEVDGIPFLVMELVDGLDLRRVQQLLGPLPVPDACAIAYQTLLGLEYLRQNGLVHRDIKPSNLMLTPAGEVKILDLGLGRYGEVNRGEELTATGLAMGTADYMAPEQRTDSHHVDIRADLYSLGCTLYKLLTGKLPSEIGEPAASSAEWSSEGQTVPTGLAAVLRRLLANDKTQRYATPAEAAEALRPFCAGANLATLLTRVSNADSEQRATHRPLCGSNKATQVKPPTASAKGETTPSCVSPSEEHVPRRRLAHWAAAVLVLAAITGVLPLGTYWWRNKTPTDETSLPPAAGEFSSGPDVPAAREADRRAAEWVLANGGTIDAIRAGEDNPQPLKPPLPNVPFQVIAISLHGIRKISDKDLARIAPLSNLQVLDLYNTNITDAGLEWIGRLHHLQRLSVHNTAITDAGIRHLSSLKDLVALNLSKTQISDRGLVHLLGLKKLLWLQLRETAVTDAGVQQLRQLTALQELYLDPINISKKAIEDLKTSLPECNINPDL